MAEVLRMMTEVWEDAGEAAMDVFVLQRMEQVMEQVAEAAQQVQVREVALIDGGSGETLPNYVSAFPGIVGGLFEEMRETVGLDIGGVLTGRGRSDGVDGSVSSGNADDDRQRVQSSPARELESKLGKSGGSSGGSTSFSESVESSDSPES